MSFSRTRISNAFAFVLILATIAGSGHDASSQQPATPKIDVQAREKEVIAHLNAVIQFYRATTSPIQKIGEPNDGVYRDQAATLSMQATQLAFQSAKAEADLLTQYQQHEGKSEVTTPEAQQRLQTMETNVEQQANDLKTNETALDKRIATANARDRSTLQAERKQLDAALDLANAMKDALSKIVGTSDTKGATGFAGNVDSLQQSLPQLNGKATTIADQLESLDQARSSGVSSQTIALFELLATEHALDALADENAAVHTQAQALRAPITAIIRGLIGRGQQLSQQAAQMASALPAKSSKNAAPPATNTDDLASITATFKSVSSASIPLAQEIIVLEQSQANLDSWRASVDREYKSILRALLLRLLVIAIALGVIFIAGELWTRATNRYVREPRRKRQVLILRRTVVGFLSALVLLFGFITHFDSLATFAGFITAGIAVGLQTILLSVAAYFLIIGRYGIKVGDRITVPPVTGEVIEVGLVRFYMMELAGSGTELSPTGRVAVFSNAVLFQAGTPIYKQLPGTEYAWHELVIKLVETANYKAACEAILKTLQSVYDTYRSAIEQQHQDVERWMHADLKDPKLESRLQFEGGALQLWARFPVQIPRAGEIDEQITEALLHLIASNPEVKAAVATMPVLQPSVKG